MSKKPNKSVNGGKLRSNPPDYFGRQAGIIWRKVVGFLEDKNEVTRIDSGLVELYCTQYEMYRNAYKHIQEHGEVQAIYDSVQDASGAIIDRDFKGFKRNPMTQIFNDSVKNLNNIGSELGLSPKSRRDLFGELNNDENTSASAEIMKLFSGN